MRISSTGVEVQALGHLRAQSWRAAWDRIRPYHALEVTSSQELSCAKFPELESQDQIPAEGIPSAPTSPPHDLKLQEKAGDPQPLAAAGPVSADPWKGRLRLHPESVRLCVGPSVSSGYTANDSLTMHFPYIVMLGFSWNYRDSVFFYSLVSSFFFVCALCSYCVGLQPNSLLVLFC